MNEARKKWVLFFVALAIIAGTVWAVGWIKSRQRLGEPGLISEKIPGSVLVKLSLPERVLDYDSTNLPTPEVVLGYLPKDTSYAQRRYFSKNGDWAEVNVVLMGVDRTSLHRPDYCVPGQGWQIRSKSTVNLPVGGDAPHELPVGEWHLAKTVPMPGGGDQPIVGIYMFWFVADGVATADFPTMLKSMFYRLILRGEQQRWAYVSYFTACLPGHEQAAAERMRSLIAAGVPLFQHPVAAAK